MAIQNIIFDLGGVILNLNQNLTIRAFQKLGANLDEINYNSTVFTDYETGKINTDTFIHTLHSSLPGHVTSDDIIYAWNAMLLDLPDERVEQIRALKKNYRLFLLSNTNELHINAIYDIYGREIFHELFEIVFLSHEIGYRKPNLDCYEYVLQKAGIRAGESVFIDDSKVNIEGAAAAGIPTIWAHQPIDAWFNEALKNVPVMKIVKS